jgi:hypothetical protein
MSIVRTLLLATAILAAHPASAAQEPQGAGAGPSQRAAELTVMRVRAAPGDLPAFRVVNRATGAVFKVYFEPAAQALAERSLGELDRMTAEVARLARADPGQVDWAAVVFSSDPSYVPPRLGGEVRWTIPVTKSGELGPEGEKMLFGTLPHEQTHAVQNSLSPKLPRWFHEGQAAWVGQKYTGHRRPDLARSWRDGAMKARAAASGPLKLASWGGMQVKREAILRQLTPEQRLRMAKDPTYSPPGPFAFGPGDMISDESDTLARYGDALALFEELEAERGGPALERWFAAVWRAPAPVDTDALVALARERLGKDLAARLK